MIIALSIFSILALALMVRLIQVQKHDRAQIQEYFNRSEALQSELTQTQNAFTAYQNAHSGAPVATTAPPGTLYIVYQNGELAPVSAPMPTMLPLETSGYFGTGPGPYLDLPLSGINPGLQFNLPGIYIEPGSQFTANGAILPPLKEPKGPSIPDLEDRWKRIAEEE